MTDKTLQRIEDLLAQYPRSQSYLDALKEVLPTFVPVNLPEGVKPKIEAQISKAYQESGAYDAQSKALSIIKDIEVSHLLGENDVVVPLMVQEYANLYRQLDLVEKGMAKLKPFNQASEVCAAITSVFEKNKLGDLLRYDLSVLHDLHGVEIDVAAAMGDFKSLRDGKKQ